MKVLQESLNSVIETAVNSEQIIGASIIVAQNGKTIFEYHGGWADREDKKSVNEQTLFRLASMTKPIVSAAAMALLERGILQLDMPITHWLPEFTPKTNDGATPKITVRHLLTHTSGLSYGFLSKDNEPYCSADISDGMDDKVLSLEENLKRLAATPLMFAPGSAWCYSLSTDVLGGVLEKACNQSLPEIIKYYITEPLGMKDTSFYVEENKSHRLAKAYADNYEQGGKARLMQAQEQVLLEGCGPIHYTPSRITNQKAYPSAGSGMVGTAKDYLIFLETIRNGGSPILKTASVKYLIQDTVEGFDVAAAGPGYGFGMGFAVVRDSKTANTPRHKGSYEWGGVYGSKMFVDPEMKLSVVILTNTALNGLMVFPVALTNTIYNSLTPKMTLTQSSLKSEEELSSMTLFFENKQSHSYEESKKIGEKTQLSKQNNDTNNDCTF